MLAGLKTTTTTGLPGFLLCAEALKEKKNSYGCAALTKPLTRTGVKVFCFDVGTRCPNNLSEDFVCVHEVSKKGIQSLSWL